MRSPKNVLFWTKLLSFFPLSSFLAFFQISPGFEPDAMASLLGRFDIASQAAPTLMGDESTLKAPSSRTALGPQDFSGGME